MSRSIPEPGQQYRHWKGKVVRVDCLDFMKRGVNEGRTIYFGKRSKAIADHTIYDDSDIVIYECSGNFWARSLSNFLEILGDVDDPIGGTMFCRFERVE
jgi:hypothetical protein